MMIWLKIVMAILGLAMMAGGFWYWILADLLNEPIFPRMKSDGTAGWPEDFGLDPTIFDQIDQMGEKSKRDKLVAIIPLLIGGVLFLGSVGSFFF